MTVSATARMTAWLVAAGLLVLAVSPAGTTLADAPTMTVAVGGQPVVFPETPAAASVNVGGGFSFETGNASGSADLQASMDPSGSVVLSGDLDVMPQSPGAGGTVTVPAPNQSSAPALPGEVLLVQDSAGGYALVGITSLSASSVGFNYALSQSSQPPSGSTNATPTGPTSTPPSAPSYTPPPSEPPAPSPTPVTCGAGTVSATGGSATATGGSASATATGGSATVTGGSATATGGSASATATGGSASATATGGSASISCSGTSSQAPGPAASPQTPAPPVQTPSSQAGAAGSFADVPPSFWAYGEIAALAQAGVISGFPDGTFRPGEPVTWAQFAKLLDQTMGFTPASGPAPGQPPFDQGQWYAPYLNTFFWGVGAMPPQLVSLIQPDAPIQREAVAWLLANEGGYSAPSGSTLSFTDAASVDGWAASAVAADGAAGVLHGYPEGSFRPHAGLTRAEAATLLTKLKGLAPAAAPSQPATPPAATGPTGQGAPAGTATAQTADLGQFVPLQAPNGEYSLMVPQGWTFVGSNTENPVVVAPQGQQEPKLGLVLLDAGTPLERQMVQAFMNPSGALASCLTQAGLSQNYGCLAPFYQQYELQMSGADAAQTLVAELTQAGNNPTNVKVTPTSSNQAVASFTEQGSGGMVDDAMLVQVFPEPDLSLQALPGLQGVQAYLNYALVAYCETPEGQMAQVLPLCSASLQSFHNVSWPTQAIQKALQQNQQAHSSIVQGAEAGLGQQAQASQMISDFGSAMRGMQYGSFMQQESRNYWSGESAIATLGGNTLVENPQTGHVYMASGGYASYCETPSGGVLGTNSATEAAGPDCQAQLQGVGPLGP